MSKPMICMLSQCKLRHNKFFIMVGSDFIVQTSSPRPVGDGEEAGRTFMSKSQPDALLAAIAPLKGHIRNTSKLADIWGHSCFDMLQYVSLAALL